MRTDAFKIVCASLIVALVAMLCRAPHVNAEDLTSFKKTCSEIGFKPGTEKYGECVLELVRRTKTEKPSQAIQDNTVQEAEIERQIQALAREQARQQALYKQLLEEQKKALDFERGQRLIELGLGIAQGGARRGTSIAPIAPPPTIDLACVRNCLNNYGGTPSNSYIGMCQRNCTR